jgi:hypothetical protein
MAAPYKPELFTSEAVLDFYENADGINYKIYGGTSPKAEYCRYIFEGTEKEIGMQKLDEALHGLRSNTENTNPYLIQVYPKAKRKGDTLLQPIPTQIVFQLNRPEKFIPYGMAGMSTPSDPALTAAIVKLTETQNLILSKLSAEEAEGEQPEAPQGFAGILNHPQFQQVAIAGISMLMDRFLNGKAQPQALAGIPENNAEQKQKALKAIDLLSEKDQFFGDHLLYLANLQDEKYKTLLSFIV